MPTRGSRAQVQSGQAQMRHGAGHGQTTGNCRPCDCHVRSGAESAQDSVRLFANFGHVAGRLDATKKTGICSVEIMYGILFQTRRLGMVCQNRS